MKMKGLILFAFMLLSAGSYAQTSDTHTVKHKKTKHKTKTVAVTKVAKPLPDWAAAHNYTGESHVYFPDYYTYYDANRGGYVFWENNQWSFTPTSPPYMTNVDLGKERVQILKNLSLELQPELDYPNTMKLYPAVHDYDNVPVPHAAMVPGGQ
jgi:hypothetical protein